MTRVWFTADLHLGHRLVAEDRGYTDTEEHDAALAAVWDRTVGLFDTVWVLGDVTVGGTAKTGRALRWIGQRPGRKHLIAGNHDRVHSMHKNAHTHLPRWIDPVGPFLSVQERAFMSLHGHRVLLSHFPYLGAGDHTPGERFAQWRFPPVDPETWIVHGHTHSWERCNPSWRSIHAGWDAWGTLVSGDTIEAMINARSGSLAAFTSREETAS